MANYVKHTTKPKRLTLAQRICRPLPPLLAHRVRELIYPVGLAREDQYSFTVRAQTGSIFHGCTVERHAYYFSVLGYCVWRNIAVALAVCKPGDHIIEIGANVGTETVGFSDIVGVDGRVSAFEPVPANLETLKAALVDVRFPNVQIYPVALSDQTAQVHFVAPPSTHKTGIGHILGDEDIDDREVFTVESVTLDSLGLSPSTLVIVDVEGVETAVLRGASAYLKANKPVMIVEVIQRQLVRAGSSVEALHDQIRALGYEAFSLERAGLGKPVYTVETTDWICIPNDQPEKRAAIHRMLQRCAWLPCGAGLNPISRVSLV